MVYILTLRVMSVTLHMFRYSDPLYTLGWFTVSITNSCIFTVVILKFVAGQSHETVGVFVPGVAKVKTSDTPGAWTAQNVRRRRGRIIM